MSSMASPASLDARPGTKSRARRNSSTARGKKLPNCLGAIGWHAAALVSNLDADKGALERNAGAVPVDVRIAGSQAFFRASARSLRASDVDLLGELSRFRK